MEGLGRINYDISTNDDRRARVSRNRDIATFSNTSSDNINEFQMSAIGYIANKLEVPSSSVKILYETTTSFPETNVEFWTAKLSSGDNQYPVYIRKSDGSLTEDISIYREAEKQAVEAKYGKIDKRLY